MSRGTVCDDLDLALVPINTQAKGLDLPAPTIYLPMVRSGHVAITSNKNIIILNKHLRDCGLPLISYIGAGNGPYPSVLSQCQL